MSEFQPLHRESRGFSRRTALKLGIVGVIGAASGAGSTALVAHLAKAPRPRYRFFTEDEAALLIEICDQIIPQDDTPGARETGAISYIDRQLCGALVRHRSAYRQGLESFRQTCKAVHGAPFESLATPGKIEALRLIESGRAPAGLWSDPSAAGFFGLVLAHTMQSFYGSPKHGGNRNYASYHMLGLDYPQVAGQNRYKGPST